MGLADGGADSLPVQRHQRPQVHDLGVDALRRQSFGGLQSEVDLPGPSEDGHILAWPLHIGLAQGNDVLAVWNLFLPGVQQLMLQEHHRVVVPDGSLQQALGVRRRGGADHLQSRNVGEQGLQTLGVLAGVPPSRAHGRPEHNGDFHLSAGHIPQLGSLVHNRVQADGDKIVVHPLHHRTHAPHGGAYGDAGEAGLADGGVDHPVGSELIPEALGNGKHIAHDTHVLADDEDVGVPYHLLMEGLSDGLTDSDLHLSTLLSLSETYIYLVTSAGSGAGALFANS